MKLIASAALLAVIAAAYFAPIPGWLATVIAPIAVLALQAVNTRYTPPDT